MPAEISVFAYPLQNDVTQNAPQLGVEFDSAADDDENGDDEVFLKQTSSSSCSAETTTSSRKRSIENGVTQPSAAELSTSSASMSSLRKRSSENESMEVKTKKSKSNTLVGDILTADEMEFAASGQAVRPIDVVVVNAS